MDFLEYFQLALLLFLLILSMKPLGLYLKKVLSPREETCLDFIFKPIEKFVYKIGAIKVEEEQNWKQYLYALVVFSILSMVFTGFIFALQRFLPVNPQKVKALSWALNLNTSSSFMTNTNWQAYAGEKAMSYFSQMTALTVQNFLSAAVGLSVSAVLVRGLSRKTTKTLGNFWVDLTRTTLYIFLPLSIVAALIFIACGVPQNMSQYIEVHTLEGATQMIAQGPVASQEAIKLIGTNGGGFFNVNSAHPYENPIPLSNFLQYFLILLIPFAQIYYFGQSIKNSKHAWRIFAALAFVFVIGVIFCSNAEIKGNPEWASFNLSNGNWEGKEMRFGLFGSSLFACITTAVSCGAVNCMHDSLTPIGGMIPMLNIQLGEVIFGGVGAGLYSVIHFIFLTIFISGLIIGRTPEYLGKKIESFDIKMTVCAILPFVILVELFTALGCYTSWGVAATLNKGPHGFSEILYAFSSASANNGSAFAGLNANTVVYNCIIAIAMVVGRFSVIVPTFALAGSMVEKKIHSQTSASFPISSFIFTALLIGIIFLLGALTFFPSLILGPIIEQLSMLQGVLFS